MFPPNYKILRKTSEIHEQWDSFSRDSIFLRKSFLTALEVGTPKNMQNFFVEFYNNSNLIGIALFQHIDLKSINPFQSIEKTLKDTLASWALNTFASSILFIGNNMMSGQNAFRFSANIDFEQIVNLLSEAAESLKEQLKLERRKIQITVWKDFSSFESKMIEKFISNRYYKFTIQPTMILEMPTSIKTESDYLNALSKKYRDQYKRIRKKALGISKRQLSISEIDEMQQRISELYLYTVSNATFNTFNLPLNHFSALKKILGADFQFYAYFIDQNLIGFNTIIKNGNTLEPYFLGYDAEEQKKHSLYLNMLYDIVGYAAAKDFQTIAFGRTALEIKSSVGAKAVDLFGFIQHSNPLINKFIAKLFVFIEPKVDWKIRNPFK